MCLDFDITHTVFEASPIGMAFVRASSGVVLQVNPAYCSFLRREKAQIVGKTWMLYTHPDDIIKSFQVYHSLKTNDNTPIQELKRYILPDGNCIHVHITITPIQFPSESQIYLVCVENRDWFFMYKQEMSNRTTRLIQYRDEVINSFVLMACYRDCETGGHLYRTRLYVQLLLEESRTNHFFSNYGIQTIAKSSMLHDIGKARLPDSILHNKGSLTSDEIEIMRTHTVLGAFALSETLCHLPGDSAFKYARDIAEFHHERWDGTGYPHGFSGEDIPFVARVMAIADAYDSLRSEHTYKKAFTHVQAIESILKESGTHFDPYLCDVLFSVHREFSKISESVSESSSPFLYEGSSFKIQEVLKEQQIV